MKIVEPSATLEQVTPDAAKLIERAGRTCYRSEAKATPDSAARFVEMLVARGHESVLEHASATIRVVCDRGVSHELVRHRIASYSQESTRYCRYREGIAVVEPPGLGEAGRLRWIGACQAAEEAYLDLLAGGASPQLARSVLPTSLKTEVVITMNFRSWLHFLHLRLAPAAHPQMRQIATMIRDLLHGACPEVFAGG